ncbi:lysine--tRNA ligase [Planctomycetota bacterium]
MSEIDKQRQDRLNNLEALVKLGLDPYGQKSPNTQPIKTIIDKSPTLIDTDNQVTAAGRIITIRKHGKTAFMDLRDSTAKIQLYLKKDKLADEFFQIYTLLDLGDIIGVKGTLFKTKTGEITISVKEITMLSKSLLPLPEKWHGLKDIEIRYRQRYLDLMTNPDAMETFKKRIRIIQETRHFLNQEGFLEVETPMMQPIPGGATARPFVTYHNTLEMNLYLRIAPELYLKRLLVGGMEKVYEINRNFRNEGISSYHNPEFTMMEVYQSYADYNDMMDLTERLIISLAKENTLTYGDTTINIKSPWPRKSYLELFQEYTGTDWDQREKVFNKARSEGLEIANRSHETIANDLFEKLVEPNLNGPVFVIDYPIAICPLTKSKRTQPEVAERFELFIAGMELANAFTELNDPREQRNRFEQQLKNKTEDTSKIDEDFLTALEYGMPPAGGLGIGIDRLVMVLTNNPSIRDIILFPTLREKS